jgi:secreted Zn-dependent insulinase-like peptidase
MQMVASALGSAVLPDGAKDMQEIVQLDQGYVYAEPHTNPDDLNHALELYYQWPERGIKHDVIAALFGEMISEPCFDTLRTKEQLGYIVACRSRPLAGSYPPAVNGLAILIQSSFKAPHHLDNLARHFVRGFISNMTVIDTPKFEAHKAALLAQIKEKDKTVHEETGRFWSEIIKRRYDCECPFVHVTIYVTRFAPHLSMSITIVLCSSL